jgi:filamentous hemagglutinin family protein
MYILEHAMKFLTLLLVTLISITTMMANPSGGNIISGDVVINQSGNTLNINSNSDKSIIQWDDFSIANGEITNFNLPNASSAVLNKVVGLNQSFIDGILNSNGNIFLINPNGIIIGQSGMINVNSFIGSTLNMSNDDFLSGNNMNFVGDTNAYIINNGTINALGSAILIANVIENNGTINANETYLREAEGNSTIKVKIKPNDIPDALNNVNNNMYGLVINQKGIKRGQTVIEKNGQTWLIDQRGTSPVYEFNNENLAVSLGFSKNGNSDNYKIADDNNDIQLSINENNNIIPFPQVTADVLVNHEINNDSVIVNNDNNTTNVTANNNTTLNTNTFTTNVIISNDTTKNNKETLVLKNDTVAIDGIYEHHDILPYKNKEHNYEEYVRYNTTQHDHDTYSRGNRTIGVNVVMHHSYSDYLNEETGETVVLDNFVNIN